MPWTDGLPPEQVEIVTAKGWQGPGDALKSYTELEKLVGTDRFAVPGKDATDADWGKVYDAFGRPKDAKEYPLTAPADAATIDYDQSLADWFRQTAHSTGMSARQAAAFHDKFVEMRRGSLKDSIAKVQAEDAERMKAFEAKHGAKAAAMKEKALMAMKALGNEEFADFLTKSGLGTDPRMIDTFAAIAEKIGEDALRGNGGGQPLGISQQQAAAEIGKIRTAAMADPKHPLMDKLHPEHQAAVDRIDQLSKIAFPEPKAA